MHFQLVDLVAGDGVITKTDVGMLTHGVAYKATGRQQYEAFMNMAKRPGP